MRLSVGGVAPDDYLTDKRFHKSLYARTDFPIRLHRTSSRQSKRTIDEQFISAGAANNSIHSFTIYAAQVFVEESAVHLFTIHEGLMLGGEYVSHVLPHAIIASQRSIFGRNTHVFATPTVLHALLYY